MGVDRVSAPAQAFRRPLQPGFCFESGPAQPLDLGLSLLRPLFGDL
jgi:hypothetical protein